MTTLCILHEGPVIFLGGRRDVGSMIGPITAVDKYGNPSINLSHDEPSPHDMKINLDFSTHLNQEVIILLTILLCPAFVES